MNEDWLMRQVKLVGEGIGHMLKKHADLKDLGEIQNDNGEMISRKDAIMNCIEANEYNKAFQLVNSLKYKMSMYDFECASSWFIQLLNSIHEENPGAIEKQTIETYSKRLSELM